MTKPDLNVIASMLRTHSASGGFNAFLGVNLEQITDGAVDIAIEVREELRQHHGYVHGGVVGALADTACSWAAATAGRDVVTSSYSIQFLAPAKGARLRAEGRIIKAGKRLIAVEARVFSESEGEAPRLSAITLASIAVVGE
jgi:uncharacterized protein (TIGR00369 family)